MEYRLTSLGESVCAVWIWVEANLGAVEKCRRTYDREARNLVEEAASGVSRR